MNNNLITRRIFLNGAAVTVTAISLIGCASPEFEIFNIDQKGQFFSARELTILSDVAEIMIPRTETPGAIDAQVATVVDGLMMTWASDQTQSWFKNLIAYFDELSQSTHKKPFDKVGLDARRAMIETLDIAAFSETPPAQSEAYKHLKYIIFRAYYTSEEAGDSHVAIPGQYNGHLTLNEYNALMKERAYGRRA